jgi:hypothetical protein
MERAVATATGRTHERKVGERRSSRGERRRKRGDDDDATAEATRAKRAAASAENPDPTAVRAQG